MAHSISYRRILHKMDYYNYQRGLIYRHLDQEGSWNTHLQNCRSFILKSIDYYKPSVVTVLGSGWLLDLPLSEMADRLSEINLVDIVHPPEVKSQISEMKNVVLREEDISGGLISEVWQKAGRRTFLNKLRSLDEIKIPVYQPRFEPGMIVSLNIFTQLESLPIELLKRKAIFNEESFLNFRKVIQQNHINFLKKYKSVLITDLSEVVTESSGKVYEINSILTDLPEGKLKDEWTWYFDLRNSDYYRKKSVFKVSAILF
jgi:hypothetical protein